jgi:hypothetical protein
VMRKDCMVMYVHSQMATLQSSVFMSVLGLVHAIINRQLRVIPSSSSLKTLSIALTASIYIGHLLNSPIASVLGSCVALGVVIEYARRTTTLKISSQQSHLSSLQWSLLTSHSAVTLPKTSEDGVLNSLVAASDTTLISASRLPWAVGEVDLWCL